ncbi:MAG: polyphosphate polymerase domain-containing protein [Rikenellaceae bacterium]
MLIDRAIEQFQGISLSEMDEVKLMNRTDRKYWFHIDLLAGLLEDVAPYYYILEVNGKRNLPYSTTYYDTKGDEMYQNHHRGKMNRYKVRRRNYISTNSSFLEVKFKSNKGRTVKVRKSSDYQNTSFNAEDEVFIRENTPYSCCDLKSVLVNGFRRLMLVSKAMNERCTIDSELRFRSDEGEAALNDLTIVEVKTDGRSYSKIIEALNLRRLRPSGFSKYCMGRSLTQSSLKQNNFKEKHRTIDKRLNNPINNINLWTLNG